MLKISHVTKYYVKSKPVISDMNLTFPATGLHIIAGKSGCGKTTLLNMIGTMDQDYIGSIEFNGVELSTLSYRKMSEYRNYESAYIFQINSLFEHLSVEENIKLALNLQGKTTNISDVLDLVGLKGFEKKKVKYLSGGERQRVGIARALAKDTKIILADEPTSALDSKNAHKIFSLLKEISKDRLVIVVTHDVKKAVQYADRMIRLVDGRVMEEKIYHETNNEAITYKKKASKTGLLWPIFRFQFRRTLIVNLFIALLLGAALTVVNISKEQQTVKNEYTQFYENNETVFNSLRTLSSHVENDISLYNVVKAIETDKPYTYFKEVSTRNGGLSPDDYSQIESVLAGHNIHYGNAEYDKVIIDGVSRQLKMNESYNGIVYYWYEPQRTPFDYYVYNEANGYNIIYGARPTSANEMLITDTVADSYLRRNGLDASDLSVLIGEELTIYDVYDLVSTCYLYVEKPLKISGIIATSQLQYYYYDYQSKIYNLLDGIVQQTKLDPYMNSSLFQPYGYIVISDHLDSYKTNHYYDRGLTFDYISYGNSSLMRNWTTTFHGLYDYKGIRSYEDNLTLDVSNRLIVYDKSKIKNDNLSGNQIIITQNFIRQLFPSISSNNTTAIKNAFGEINGKEITLGFHSLNGIKEMTFEIIGVATTSYNSYFYISADTYSELYAHNNPITYPSITVGLEKASAKERAKIIDALYEKGYVLVPVSVAPGVWGEFVPTQGEVVLVDDEGFEEEANISIHNLFSVFYNNTAMNDTNSVLEIVSSVSSFVLIMSIVLSVAFVYLKERRQKDYTMRLTAMGVPTNKIIWMNLINYCLIALIVGGLSIYATGYVVNIINKSFILSIHDIETVGYVHRIRILFTDASYARSFFAAFIVLVLGIITAAAFVKRHKK